MPSFSHRSMDRLRTCHPDLVRVLSEVVKHVDCTVLEGHRSNERQLEMMQTGRSKLGPGQSKHNRNPSLAVDVIAYPIDWEDWKRHYAFAGFMLATGVQLGVQLRSGLDWDQDWDFRDQRFNDAPHFELVDLTPEVLAA